MRWRGSGRGRRAGMGVLACAALSVGAGCIGATDREDFDRIIQQRGGGLTSELPVEAVDAVAGELGVDDFEVRALTVAPPTETVTFEVRDPAEPENLDTYVVRRGDIESVEPVRLTAADDLDRQTFAVSSLALDRVEAMVDAALAEFDRTGGYVSSMAVRQEAGTGGDADVVVQLNLESPRATGIARFTADGELVGVTRS